MEEIRSGSILRSVPEDLRPRPEVASLQSAKSIIRDETIESKSKPKKVIRLSQVELIETDSEEEDVLSLKVGIAFYHQKAQIAAQSPLSLKFHRQTNKNTSRAFN